MPIEIIIYKRAYKRARPIWSWQLHVSYPIAIKSIKSIFNDYYLKAFKNLYNENI